MSAHSSLLLLSPSRVAGRLLVSLFALALAAVASAQNTDTPRRREEGGGGGGDERRSRSPADMQARMLSSLRERFGVTSDEEWGVISERMTKVMEARRSMGGGTASPFLGGGRPPGGGGTDRGAGGTGGGGDRATGGDRGTGGAPGGFRGTRSPETEALTRAVADKLPDAEIKARITKLRETRKANEAKLEKAQDELRAVLSVRQEAQAVLMGLLN